MEYTFRILNPLLLPNLNVLSDLTIIGNEYKTIAIQIYNKDTLNPVYLSSSYSVSLRFITTIQEQTQMLEINGSIYSNNRSIITVNLIPNETLLITDDKMIVKLQNGSESYTLVRENIIKKIQYEDNIVSGDEITNLPTEIIEGDMNILEDCLNNTGTTILKGKVVYLTGIDKQIDLATRNGTLDQAQPIGIALENIVPGATGNVLTNGITSNLSYSFPDGSELYLGINGDLEYDISGWDDTYITFVGTWADDQMIIDIDFRGYQ